MKKDVHLRNARSRVRKIILSCHSRHVLDAELNTNFGDYLESQLKVTSPADAEQLSGTHIGGPLRALEIGFHCSSAGRGLIWILDRRCCRCCRWPSGVECERARRADVGLQPSQGRASHVTRVLTVAAIPSHLQAAPPRTMPAPLPLIQASNRCPTAVGQRHLGL
jgi:hypothetical protein